MKVEDAFPPGGRYFGEPWPSGVCDSGIQVDTPVGEQCVWCEEAIQQGDQGSFMYGVWRDSLTPRPIQPVHRECSLRSVIGGIGHLEDHAFWCKGPGNDTDGGRTKRQSALEVWEWVMRHGLPRTNPL